MPTFALHLRSAGYQTSMVGKMHFDGADQLHGYEERLTTDIYPANFGWTPDWQDAEGRFDSSWHNLDSVVGAGIADTTNQLDDDDDVGYQTIRNQRDLARAADSRPWMITASFAQARDRTADDPHSPRLRRLMRSDVTEVIDARFGRPATPTTAPVPTSTTGSATPSTRSLITRWPTTPS